MTTSRKYVPRRRWLFPMGCEREYLRFVREYMAIIREALKSDLIPSTRSLVARSSIGRRDEISEDDVAVIIKKAFDRIKGKIDKAQLASEMRKIANLTSNFNATQWRQVMRSALQVDVFHHEPWLRELADQWVAENVRLITSVPDQLLGDVEGIVRRGMMDGTLTDDIADDIEERTGVAERRARLIARDQVGKLNGDLTQHRQMGAGIEEYIWSTSKDSRVRPKHVAREGMTFRWDSPPPGGHPGKEIYCRCVALPVVDLERINILGATPGSLKKIPENGTINTGAISGALNPESREATQHARKYYGLVRAMKTDTKHIAKNTGWDKGKVDRIKDHVFVLEHILDGPVPKRFEPDYEMAQSWQRLIDGRGIKPHDVILLRHEYLELTLMEQGLTQSEAHDLANAKHNYSEAIDKEKRHGTPK